MSVYEFGPFQLDEERLLLLERGEPIPIGPKVVETLLALVEHPGEVYAKSDLLARIWPEGYVDEANLAQNIYVLRKTLRKSWNAGAIETIPRRGYRFVAPVFRRDDVPRPQPAPVRAHVSPWRGLAIGAGIALALLGGSALNSGKVSGSDARSQVIVEDTRLYAIGRYYWNQRTRDGIAKSVAYFSQIVANDPRDARGYAGLASANAIMANYGYGTLPAKLDVARARAYAHSALALDPNSGEAYAVLGLLWSATMKETPPEAAAALGDLRRAIALDPSSGSAHEWLGIALLQRDRVHEAYGELAKAAQLDPLSVSTTAWLGTTAYLERDYNAAISYEREALDLSPQRGDAYETLGLAYEAMGERTAADRTFRQLAAKCTSCGGESAALRAALYARSGQPGRARTELAIARAQSKRVDPEDLAAALSALGDRRGALSWLRRWRSDSDYAATEIANDPRFANLRDSGKQGA